jgi:hypothetical protein
METIKNLRRDGNKWFWEFADETYCTDARGEGIWMWRPDGTWQQLVGTCQFSLYGYSVSGARKKINRYHNG